MIISDRHRLAFIHIPKCAGSTIRRDLVASDPECCGMRGLFTAPDGDRLDMVHLTLSQLRQYFPTLLQTIRSYESYAVIREPRQRFASALAYYMRSQRHDRISVRDMSRLEETAGDVCAHLRNARGDLEARFVHFQRQVRYARLDGEQIVQNLYPLDALSLLGRELNERHGIMTNFGSRVNATRRKDGALERTVKAAAAPLYRSLAPAARNRLRNFYHRMCPASPDGIYEWLFRNRELSDFVTDYYSEDIELHRGLVAAFHCGNEHPKNC